MNGFKDVHFTEDTFSIDLMDGRTITVPLVWYPRLLKAEPKQRERWRVCGGGYGIHGEELDENLSTAGLLREVPLHYQIFRRSSFVYSPIFYPSLTDEPMNIAI